MKKLIILSLILAAGLTAYPQSSRSSRESKSNSGRSASKATSSRSSSSSKSKATKSYSANKAKASKSNSGSSSRSKATQSKPSSSNRSKATQSKPSSSNRSKATQSRSASSSRSQATQNRSGSSNRSKATQSRAGSSGKSQATQSRSSSASSRSSANRVSGSSVSRDNQVKTSASRSSRSANQAVRSGSKTSNSASRSVARSDSKSTGNKSIRSASTEKISGDNNRSKSSASSSYSRSDRQGSKVYVRRDGEKFRHQNDEVFASKRYKVDYRDANDLRRSKDFRRVYNNYNSWHSNRYRRTVVVRHYHFGAPLGLDIRRVRYPYRRPMHMDLCWTPYLHNRFMYYYPMHTRWNNNYGSYVESISSYEAMHYVGSVKRIYGKVEEVYYSPEDRTYTLYFGAPFPYHDFSVVVPRNIAKDISWSPTWHFEDEFVWAVGLIDIWEDKPEIVIHDRDQLRRY
ncbi:MAG: hypothetical protein HN936_07025 [Bacteroidetes bacterium]|nr:hypothetical protein [Bacteroidota bacterium]